jgi:type III secretory pathway component EscV
MYTFLILIFALLLLNLIIIRFCKKAEISAHFSQDTLNQLLISIDNELKIGKISEAEAENKKQEILNKNLRLIKTAKALRIAKLLFLIISLVVTLLFGVHLYIN